MTPAQLSVLKTAILAETAPEFVALRQANDETGMANWYNADSGFVVRRSTVMSNAIGPALNYVAVSSLTTANRDRATTFLLLNPASFSPSVDIESYWETTFGGALGGEGENTRAALRALWRRTVNRVERLFCTGTGTQLAPGVLGSFEGTIRAQDISDALSI